MIKKRKARKPVAVITLIAMLVSLLPTMAFATDSTASRVQIDGQDKPLYYALTDDGMIDTTEGTTDAVVKPVKENEESTDRVTMAKTIQGTATENEFDITLKVTTTEEIQSLELSPDAAVVLVMDASNSMNDTERVNQKYQERWKWAQEAATTFIGEYAKAGGNAQRWVSVVEFGTGANRVQDWVNLNDATAGATNTTSTTAAIKTIKPGFSSSYEQSFTTANKWQWYNGWGDNDYWECTSYRCRETQAGDKNHEPASNHFHCSYSTDYWSTCEQKDNHAHTVRQSADSGGTNIKAGLMLAQNIIADFYQDDTKKETKCYVILLSDGGATYRTATGDGSYAEAHKSTQYIQEPLRGTGGTEEAIHRTEAVAVANSLRTNHDATIYTVAYGINGAEKLSGIYDQNFDAKDPTALAAQFKAIVENIKKLAEAWTVTDPMGERIIFLKGDDVTNRPGSVSFDAKTQTLNWNLKKELAQPTKEGDITTYTYTLTYTIGLDNLSQGFKPSTPPGMAVEEPEHNYYLTNGPTKLTYALKDNEQESWKAYEANFFVPQVEGYQADFNFEKVADHDKTVKLSGATFKLQGTGDAATVVLNKDSQTIAEQAGQVAFTGIPSGYQYTLTETKAPEGYLASDEVVAVEIAYGKVAKIDHKVPRGTYQFTNTLDEGTTSVTFTKTWVGPLDGDKAVYPTGTLTIEQSSDNGTNWSAYNAYDFAKGVNQAVVNADGTLDIGGTSDKIQEFTVTLPEKSAATGNDYQYRITETGNGIPEGYTPSYAQKTVAKSGSETIDNRHHITNTVTGIDETMTITVNKAWLNPDTTAPDGEENIMVSLYQNGEKDPLATQTLQNGTATFTELPLYTDGGEYIVYTVTDSINGYTASAEPINTKDYVNSQSATVTLTNEIDQANVTINGTKTWQDDTDGDRPESITVELYNGGTDPIAEQTVTANTSWKYSFTEDSAGNELPKYKMIEENGKVTAVELINYTIQEQGVAEDNTVTIGDTTYLVTVDGYDITNTRTGTTGFTFAKVWEDSDDAYSTRPDTIDVQLLADNVPYGEVQTVDAGGGSFENLPKYNATGAEITYSVTDTVPGYTSSFEATESGNVLTNTLKTEDSVPINKVWQDNNNSEGKRPASITVNLLADGQQVASQEINGEGNEWSYTFTDLPEFRYEETEIAPPQDSQETQQQGVEGDSVQEGAVAQTTSDIEEIEETEEIEAETSAPQYKEIPITYTIEEDGVNEGQLVTPSATYNVTIEDYTITNTITGEDTYTVNKSWVKPSDVATENVTFQIGHSAQDLIARTTEFVVDQEETLTVGETSVTFTVPRYDEGGNLIAYQIGEVLTPESSYSGSTAEQSEDGFTWTFTNTFNNTFTDLTGTKVWQVPEGTELPDDITVGLYQQADDGDATLLETQTVSAATDQNNEQSGWQFVFGQNNGEKTLPVYQINEDQTSYTHYTYFVREMADEIAVENNGSITMGEQLYNVTYGASNTIINTIAGNRDIHVTKQWLAPQGTAHPAVTFTLYSAVGDNEATSIEQTVELPASTVGAEDEMTSGTFTDLPRYDEQGQVIRYWVEESIVEGYTPWVAPDSEAQEPQYRQEVTGQTVTFTNVINPADVTISGVKTWADVPEGVTLPETITVGVFDKDNQLVMVEGTPLTTAVTADEWAYELTILGGKYDSAGAYLGYTVREIDPVTGNAISHNGTITYDDSQYGVIYSDLTQGDGEGLRGTVRDANGNIIDADITNSYKSYYYQVNHHYTTIVNGVRGEETKVNGEVLIGTAGETISVTKEDIEAGRTYNGDTYGYVANSGNTEVTLETPNTAEKPYTINLYYERTVSSGGPGPIPPDPGGDDYTYDPTPPPPTPTPTVIIPDAPVPLAPTPMIEEAPLEEVVIEETPIPLSENPKTGEGTQQAFGFGILLLALGALLKDLRRKED